MNRHDLTETILAYARQLGFTLAGVTVPGKMTSFHTFAQWVNDGNAAGMAYLERPDTLAIRANSQLILPDARSILVVGLPYFSQAEQPTVVKNPGNGKVAAYARGLDYHDVIPVKLAQLVEKVETWIGRPIAHRVYTDTGPILEREMAVMAGLGWIGKNSCLISPQFGSYFLLAELFLDLDLEPAQALVTDHCGSCNRCVQSCPTHCIQPDRTILAQRCISFQTIENRAEMDQAVAEMAADWFFGCDICQNVCPWNIRFSHTPPDVQLEIKPGSETVDAIEILLTSPAVLKEKYKTSPLLRSKPAGLYRNAINVLNNSKSLPPQMIEKISLVNQEAAMIISKMTNQTIDRQ